MVEHNSEDAPPTGSRWRLGWGCLTVVVLLVLVAGISCRLEYGRAARQVKKEIARLRAAGQPVTTVEIDRAYRPAPGRPDMTAEILAALAFCEQKDIQQAGETFPIVGNKGGEAPPPLPGQPWENLPEVEAWLAQLQPAFDTFRDVAEREGTARYPADYRLGPGTLLPSVQSLRSGSRVLSLQTLVDLYQRRPESAVNRIIDALALARTLENEPTLISHLVRSALCAVAVGNLETVLEHSHVADADLVRLQFALGHCDARSGLKQALQGERASCLLMCQLPLSAAAQGPAVSGDEAEALSERDSRLPYDAAKLLEIFRRLLEANDESLAKLVDESQAVEGEIKHLAGSQVERLRTPLVMLVLPAQRSAIEGIVRSDAICGTAAAAIACERFRRETGNWPQGWRDLVPTFLPAEPEDPFSGRPLLLSTKPRSCLVYSVGANQIDDGGDVSLPQRLDTGFEIRLPPE